MAKPYRELRDKMSPTARVKASRKTIINLATTVFENRGNAISWLSRPQFGLGDRVPIDIIKTPEGYEAVVRLLRRIEYGVLS